MSEQVINHSIGYCGKIPTKGDFIQSDFDVEFLAVWNEWLQAVIAVSKELLEQNWLDCYLTSPIWHFSLSAGVCGDFPVVGTFIPSVDKVNRYFPFTIVAQHNFTAVQAWYENKWDVNFEKQILEVLEDKLDLENWFIKFNIEPILIKGENINILNINSKDKIKKSWVMKGDHEPSLLQLLDQQYQQQFAGYSLWWTAGSDLVEPCFIVTDGLPQVSQFVSMLDGQWQQRDWNISEIRKGK